jgi:hypothetical protein
MGVPDDVPRTMVTALPLRVICELANVAPPAFE